MKVDKTTLSDLSVTGPDPLSSVAGQLDMSLTSAGSEQLKKDLSTPLSSVEKILNIQHSIQAIDAVLDNWTRRISNGTIMVIERFFESQLDPVPEKINHLNAYLYKLLHAPDFSLARYSLTHCLDFIQGLKEIGALFNAEKTPKPLRDVLERIFKILENTPFPAALANRTSSNDKERLQLVRFIIYEFRPKLKELLELYARLDAWYGMAAAKRKFSLCFPEFIESEEPVIEARGLYHILLEKPIPYDITMNRNRHFMFLTGANMAGKSTFIKSLGAAAFLAHTGMAVPANSLRLTYFDGMISNINVTDDIAKGESYFYSEVLRIRSTIEKISDGRKWLVLIDEIFKGTNIQDAMKCSLTVIEGLAKAHHSLFILSTHLHELSDSLSPSAGISFNYFETEVKDDKLVFSYRLRDGVSRDRLGYLILEKEGVVKLLQQLS